MPSTRACSAHPSTAPYPDSNARPIDQVTTSSQRPGGPRTCNGTFDSRMTTTRSQCGKSAATAGESASATSDQQVRTCTYDLTEAACSFQRPAGFSAVNVGFDVRGGAKPLFPEAGIGFGTQMLSQEIARALGRAIPAPVPLASMKYRKRAGGPLQPPPRGEERGVKGAVGWATAATC